MTTRKARPVPTAARVGDATRKAGPVERKAGKTDDHPRNTAAMLTSPRCGAKTRNGGACRSPAVQGKKRCRMHGGAPGSGAPKGNKNALTHGRFTKEAIKRRKRERAFLRKIRERLPNIRW